MHGPPPPQQGFYAPPPAPPKPRGCFANAMIIFGLCALCGVGTCALLVATNKRSPEEQKRDDAIRASYEDAKRVAADEEEARVRKLCKLPASAPVFVAAQDDVRALCKVTVTDLLKAPSTAEFSYDATTLVSDDGGCRLIYNSSVEAQNAFGVKLRTRFSCVYDQRTGATKATLLE